MHVCIHGYASERLLLLLGAYEHCVGTEDDQSPVAMWCEWHQQQTNVGKEEAFQDFMTVQVNLQSSGSDESMSLTHLRHWLQVLLASCMLVT